MSVPMVDLKVQYESIKREIDEAVLGVIQSGMFILGPQGTVLEKSVAAYHGVPYAVGVASGTDALHLALVAAGVQKGDEVITTPFTFIATAEAISYVGATPVFVDIQPDTFNIDPDRIREKVTSRTKVILPVHLYGHPADMDPIMQIARERGIIVVEDCAQSFGATYRGKTAGSFGDLACFSFFPSKNLGCYGDGGMVLASDAAVAERLRSLRNHGSKVRYFHDEIGFNSRLDELQAAILNIKIKHIDDYNAKRAKNAALYTRLLAGTDVIPPVQRPETKHVFHQYTIRLKNRDAVKQRMDERRMSSMIHYPVPLHLQAAYKDLGMTAGSLPHAEQAAQEVLSLPMYPELAEEQVREVVGGLRESL